MRSLPQGHSGSRKRATVKKKRERERERKKRQSLNIPRSSINGGRDIPSTWFPSRARGRTHARTHMYIRPRMLLVRLPCLRTRVVIPYARLRSRLVRTREKSARVTNDERASKTEKTPKRKREDTLVHSSLLTKLALAFTLASIALQSPRNFTKRSVGSSCEKKYSILGSSYHRIIIGQ